MPTMLTTQGILDSVLTGIQDNSTEIRTKLLSWLNKVYQRVAIERDWRCLQTTLTGQALVTGAVALPSDFAKLISVSQSDNFYLDKDNELTSKEVFDLGTTSTYAVGYRIVNNILTIYPTQTGNVDIEYIKEVPAYADNTTSTVFPVQFKNIIERACMDWYYEFDMDDRAITSLQLDETELKRLKKFESSKDAMPRYSNKGYMRDE